MTKEHNEEIELKPCPFCGYEAELRKESFDFREFKVYCCGCGATTDGDQVKSIAIERWNKRKCPFCNHVELEKLTTQLNDIANGYDYFNKLLEHKEVKIKLPSKEELSQILKLNSTDRIMYFGDTNTMHSIIARIDIDGVLEAILQHIKEINGIKE